MGFCGTTLTLRGQGLETVARLAQPRMKMSVRQPPSFNERGRCRCLFFDTRNPFVRLYPDDYTLATIKDEQKAKVSEITTR